METATTQRRRRRRQAFLLAPWRARVRTASGLLLWGLVLLLVGGMYLGVNGRLARAGRQVLVLEARRDELRRANAELRTQLAALTAADKMKERAEALGFRPARAEEIEYLVVEGYVPEPEFQAPRPPGSPEPRPTRLSPAYTETLGEWLVRWLGLGGEAP